jgi:aspartate aminotransferase-like enzyme
MKLFTVGPVQMYRNTLEVKSHPVPYFRTDEFSKFMLDMDSRLKRLVGTSDKSKTIYLTASGTAAMEATLLNLFTKKDKLLVINGGSFGQRFCEMCDVHQLNYSELIVPFSNDLTVEMMNKFDNCGYTGVLVNIDETSIGKMYDIKIISNFCKRNNAILVVDAISSFLCDHFTMDEDDIDVTIISTQKGLCVSPGMSCVFLNKKVVDDRVLVNNPHSLYFDFKSYIQNMDRGQTPFTPAVGTLVEMEDQISHIEKMGLENWLSVISDRCHYFRENIVKIGYSIPKYKLSNAVTPVIVPNYKAHELFSYLKDKCSFTINPCSGEHSNDLVRVASIGELSIDDYKNLLKCMTSFLK